MRRILSAIAAMTLTLTLALPFSASAQWAVFDPANFSENVINAYHTLQANIDDATKIANQINQLSNQAQMIQNQALNLAALPESLVNSYRTNMQNLMGSIQNIQGLTKNMSNLRDQYRSMYPTTYASDAAWQNLNSYVQKWNTTDAQNMQDALTTGGNVLHQLPATQADIERLGTDSEKATGALSAIQAGNQLSMNVAGQLASLNAQTATYQQAMIQHAAADASGNAAASEASSHATSDWPTTKPTLSNNGTPSPNWSH